MYLSKCFIRIIYKLNVRIHLFGKEGLPLVHANPLDVKEKLRKLIINSKHRKEVADKGHEYCLKIHDSVKVAKKYIKLYREVLENPKEIDLDVVWDYIEWQEKIQYSGQY